MKITVISDTHGLHHSLALAAGDVLIHGGDFTEIGEFEEAIDFIEWVAKQPFAEKIVIAGNHDFCMEEENHSELEQYFAKLGVHYLNDSGCEIDGINFWGSPITPVFFNWAFNRNRGAQIRQHWSLIPPNTDVLITHGPPLGMLDQCGEPPENVGCKDLLARVNYLKPRVHVFGHIHSATGITRHDNTLFINAAVLDDANNLAHQPKQFELGVHT